MLKLRVQPIHPWTIGQTAASSAFRLTSEVTANCPQQKQPERCERTAVFVHSKPCANFVLPISFTLFTHSYNSQPVEVVDKFFDTGVGTSPDENAQKRNGCQWRQQSQASSRNHAKELWNAKSRCLKTTLHFLCTKLFALNIIDTFYSNSYDSQAVEVTDKFLDKGVGSWEFSLEEVGISPTYQATYLLRGRIKVPHLMSKRPIKCWLATLNASSAIMSHALEQKNAARIGVICQGASSAPHFLLARLQGYSFQFVFQLVLPAYTLHLPSICVLPTAFKTFCSNKLGILTGRSWHFSDISRLITPVAPNFRQKSWNQY